MHWFLYTKLTVPQRRNTTIRPLDKLSQETELFPIPQKNCFPILPINLLISFCEKAKKRPALMIQSADYPLWNQNPIFLSEQQALQLATEKAVKLYHDTVSESSYFCYLSQTDQHIVWVEDGFHLQKKFRILQKSGITEIALPVFSHNFNTIMMLLEHLK